MPNGIINAATASIGIIDANFIEVGTIKPPSGQGSVIIEGNDPCCVYVTGSSGVASVSSASIQPKCTTHNNSGHFSVIGGGDNHCIIDSLNTGTPFHDGIFSGKDNCILDASSTFIGGGFKNLVSSPSSGSVIGGGVCNQIEGDSTSGNESIIVGGRGNCLKTTTRAFIGGGKCNIISSSLESLIVGGDNNTVRTAGLSSIAGGQGNCIIDIANAGFIGGGISNQITSKTSSSYDTIINGNNNEITLDLNKGAVGGNTIIGGSDNTINICSFTSSCIPDGFNQIGGGCENIISGSVQQSTIVGGKNNEILHDDASYNPDFLRSTILINSGSSIAGGINNLIYNGSQAFIGAGLCNRIGIKDPLDPDQPNYLPLTTDGLRSAIISGQRNNILGGGVRDSIIGAGNENVIEAIPDTIMGWICYSSSPFRSMIGTGNRNHIISSKDSFIGAGCGNLIRFGACNSIIGGTGNEILGINSDNSTIGGGIRNRVYGCNGGVFTGAFNDVFTTENTIASGFGNRIVGSPSLTFSQWDTYNFIGGGELNYIQGGCNILAGGGDNCICNAGYSSVGGGYYNAIHNTWHSGILSGVFNSVGQQQNQQFTSNGNALPFNFVISSVVAGGTSNGIMGCHSFIGGGCDNGITSASCHSAILGGALNTLCHNNSFIVGSNLTSTRACTTFMNSTDISGSVDLNPSEIPTSDVGLRVGQLYRTGSAFDEIRIKL